METERELLARLYRKIELQFGQGEANLWANRQFLQLSELIFEKTGVLISSSTLKRMFGKVKTEADYIPQIDTRNALAIYCGFENWTDFVKQQKEEPVPAVKRSVFRLNKGIAAILLTIALLLLFGAVYFFIDRNDTIAGEIRWQVLKTEGIAPFSCVVNYDVPQDAKGPFYLILGKDTINLDPSLKTYTHYFKLPGFVRLEVHYNGQKIGEKEITVGSDGWKGYVLHTHGMEEMINIVPAWHNSGDIYLMDSSSFISAETVKSLGLDINRSYWTEYRNYQKFDIPLDTFSFDASIENTSRIPTIFCNHICINLVGTGGKVRIYFNKPGCSRWLSLQFGDKEFNGRDYNLESLSVPLEPLRKINLQVKGDSAKVYIDGQPVFSTTFKNTLGELRGVQFDFAGSGRFENVSIRSGKGEVKL